MLISLSIAPHERSNSIRVLVVYNMVLNKFKAMLVSSDRSGSILGCLITGIVMRDKDLKDQFLCFLRFTVSVLNYVRRNYKTLN